MTTARPTAQDDAAPEPAPEPAALEPAAPDPPALGTCDAPAVGVLAADLIWASRLVAAVEKTGLRPVRLNRASDLAELLRGSEAVAGVLVDVGGRGGEPLAVVEAAAAAGLVVLGVAQHEDLELRKRAVAAGATRVLSYRKFFEEGPAVVARWLLPGDEPRT